MPVNRSNIARNNKNKGRLFQQEVRDMILSKFTNLEPDDCRSTSMGAGGEDIQFSPLARKTLGIQVECKRKSSFKSLYDFMAQATSHGNKQPVVVLRQDRSRPLALVDFEYLLDLIKGKNNEDL